MGQTSTCPSSRVLNPATSATSLKGREIDAKREGLRSFAMNQNSPTRGSLEDKTGWISTLVYSVEARLNLLKAGHIPVNPVVQPWNDSGFRQHVGRPSRLQLGVRKARDRAGGTFSWTGGTGKYAGIRGDGNVCGLLRRIPTISRRNGHQLPHFRGQLQNSDPVARFTIDLDQSDPYLRSDVMLSAGQSALPGE